MKSTIKSKSTTASTKSGDFKIGVVKVIKMQVKNDSILERYSEVAKPKFRFPVFTSLKNAGNHGKKPTLKDREVAEAAKRRILFLDRLEEFIGKFEERNSCRVHYNIENLNIRKSR